MYKAAHNSVGKNTTRTNITAICKAYYDSLLLLFQGILSDRYIHFKNHEVIKLQICDNTFVIQTNKQLNIRAFGKMYSV